MNKFIQGILRIGLALYAMYGIYISYEFSNMFVDLPKQIGRIIGTIVLIYLALIFCGNHLAQGIQALKKKECKKIGYLTIPGIISGLFQLIIFVFVLFDAVDELSINIYLLSTVFFVGISIYFLIIDFKLVRQTC